MSHKNFAAMSDQELKRYFLTHRDDKEAFYAYLDRRHARGQKPTIAPDDPAWEDKILAAIQAQIDGVNPG